MLAHLKSRVLKCGFDVTCAAKIKATPEAALKCQLKDCFNRCSQLSEAIPFQMHCLFRLAVPAMEKKLDSESNDKESGEYRGVVVTHPYPNP